MHVSCPLLINNWNYDCNWYSPCSHSLHNLVQIGTGQYMHLALNQALSLIALIHLFYARKINGGREPGRVCSHVGCWWRFMDMIWISGWDHPPIHACLNQVWELVCMIKACMDAWVTPTTNSKPCPWKIINFQHVTKYSSSLPPSINLILHEERESLVQG